MSPWGDWVALQPRLATNPWEMCPLRAFSGPPCANRRFCSRQKARVISATSLLISSANPVAAKLFSHGRCTPARLSYPAAHGRKAMPAMRGLVAALTLLCCSLLAGSAPAKPLGPDYEKLKALLPPGPDAAFCFARTYDAE